VRGNTTISHRGSRFEIGRGQNFYGIWAIGNPWPQPIEWWPDTPGGWAAAWARFTSIEPREAITDVRPAVAAAGRESRGRAIGAGGLLAAGVLIGVIGLFPGYFGSASLTGAAPELVPHLFYLAGWAAAAVLVLLGGRKLAAGSLLAAGISVVTLGFFVSDLGTALARGGGGVGAGLVLGIAGWLLCTAGAGVALALRRSGGPGRLRRPDAGTAVVLLIAAIGAAVAFVPSWDRYVLRTASGVVQTLTEGYAFANPGLVIAGNVLVIALFVAAVAAAAAWRPVRAAAALLAGAVIPMVAQIVSAVVGVREGATPAMFGISPGQAAGLGLTINSGVTAAFWFYCVFVLALAAACAWMAVAPEPGRPVPAGLPEPPAPPAPDRLAVPAGMPAPAPAAVAAAPAAAAPAVPPPSGPSAAPRPEARVSRPADPPPTGPAPPS
jgi:hypothetical protein